jgi:hypothetical protein
MNRLPGTGITYCIARSTKKAIRKLKTPYSILLKQHNKIIPSKYIPSLQVLPGVSEAIAVGFISSYLFDMPLAWGFVLGFILGAVSPAVVCGGMFDLQRGGYG